MDGRMSVLGTPLIVMWKCHSRCLARTGVIVDVCLLVCVCLCLQSPSRLRPGVVFVFEKYSRVVGWTRRQAGRSTGTETADIKK